MFTYVAHAIQVRQRERGAQVAWMVGAKWAHSVDGQTDAFYDLRQSRVRYNSDEKSLNRPWHIEIIVVSVCVCVCAAKSS